MKVQPACSIAASCPEFHKLFEQSSLSKIFKNKKTKTFEKRTKLTSSVASSKSISWEAVPFIATSGSAMTSSPGRSDPTSFTPCSACQCFRLRTLQIIIYLDFPLSSNLVFLLYHYDFKVTMISKYYIYCNSKLNNVILLKCSPQAAPHSLQT